MKKNAFTTIVILLCAAMVLAGCQTSSPGSILPTWVLPVLAAANALLDDVQSGATNAEIAEDIAALLDALPAAEKAESIAKLDKSPNAATITAVIAAVKVVLADFAHASEATTGTKITHILSLLMSIYSLII